MSREKEKRTRIIGIRLNPDEYQEINKQWKNSGSRQLSDYARKMLFGQAIIKSYRNVSMDAVMLELIKLRKTLDGIAANFDQTTKKLSSADQKTDLKIWLEIQQSQSKQLQAKIDEIKSRVNLIADKWLR